MNYTEQTRMIIRAIKEIPYGKVDTYGGVALRSGYPEAARQVVRILCSLSEKEDLPWHRVVNRSGEVSLEGTGGKEQAALLFSEGVIVCRNSIDLKKYRVQMNQTTIL